MLEQSWLLRLRPEISERAFQQGIGKNIEEKVQFLISLPPFQLIPKNVLMPVAGNMVHKTYKLGEYLVREGDVPPGLFLIKSGSCLTVYEIDVEQDFTHADHLKLTPKEVAEHMEPENPLVEKQNIKNPCRRAFPVGHKFLRYQIMKRQSLRDGTKKIQYKDCIEFGKIEDQIYSGTGHS